MMLKSFLYAYLMLLMWAIAVIVRLRDRFSSVLTKFNNFDNLKLCLASGQLLAPSSGVSENESLIIFAAVAELLTAKTVKLITS